MPPTRYLYRQIFAFAMSIASASFALPAAICQTASAEPHAACAAYASVPLPAEATKVSVPKEFPACASYRSYRGIGRPVNYSEARGCAWRERLAQEAGLPQNPKEGTAWVVGGSLILADIYFNGAGVERNIPLALRFACESEEAMVELALPDVEKLKDSPRSNGPFEFCKYAATTFTMNFCFGYENQFADDRKSRYYNSLKSSMTSEQESAFEKLLTAENSYIGAHASEVYQGGTIRGIRTMGSEDILKDLFHTELVHFERGKWPALSNDRIATTDALMDREYQKKLQQLREKTKEDIAGGAVASHGLASAQRAWETYRQAWVAFARVRYPSAANAIRAQVTLDRYRLLKTIS